MNGGLHLEGVWGQGTGVSWIPQWGSHIPCKLISLPHFLALFVANPTCNLEHSAFRPAARGGTAWLTAYLILFSPVLLPSYLHLKTPEKLQESIFESCGPSTV